MSDSANPTPGFRLDATTLRQSREPPQPPPRLVGDYARDMSAMQEWMKQLYMALLQSGLGDPVYQFAEVEIDPAAPPSPKLTTMGRAQATANLALKQIGETKDALATGLKDLQTGLNGKFSSMGGTISGPVTAETVTSQGKVIAGDDFRGRHYLRLYDEEASTPGIYVYDDASREASVRMALAWVRSNGTVLLQRYNAQGVGEGYFRLVDATASGGQISGHTIWTSGNFDPSTKATLGSAVNFATNSDIRGSTAYLAFRSADGATRYGYVGNASSGNTSLYLLSDAASIFLYAEGAYSATVLGDRFVPYTNNTKYLGDSSRRWIQLYAVNGTVNTSDRIKKTNIRQATEAEIRVGRRLRRLGVFFQWRDKVAIEGEDVARLHAGMISQEVEAAFQAEGLNAARYSLWCEDPEMREVFPEGTIFDENGMAYDAQGEIVEPVLEPTGRTIKSLRYDELHSFMIACMSAEMDQLDERLGKVDPPGVARYSKRRLFGAMTDEQYDLFEQTEASQNKRRRRIFQEAMELSEDDPDWPDFLELMETTYGADEARRLLEFARL